MSRTVYSAAPGLNRLALASVSRILLVVLPVVLFAVFSGIVHASPARIGATVSTAARTAVWLRCVYFSVVAVSLWPRSLAIVGICCAIQDSHRGVAVPEVMQSDIAKPGLAPNLMPVTGRSMAGLK